MITKDLNFASVNNRHIYSAISATLKHLRPKYCLEIGTFQGNSAEVFQHYFDNYQPDGLLVTIDIKIYQKLPYKNVCQLQVHPHVVNSTTWHYVKEEELLPAVNDSATANIEIVKRNFPYIEFDFCFLDGDHQLPSVINDFAIARALLKQPQYILFDDIDCDAHQSAAYFRDYIENNPKLNVETFADWNLWVGAALLWNKELI